jgi:hypothetical protein
MTELETPFPETMVGLLHPPTPRRVYMDKKSFWQRKNSFWQRRRRSIFVVAPANATTWVVAFSRRLIPGALFTSRAAAVRYAYLLAGTIGLGSDNIRVLDA